MVQKWVKLKDFLGHRDGVWEVTGCPWDVGYFGSASAGMSFLKNCLCHY